MKKAKKLMLGGLPAALTAKPPMQQMMDKGGPRGPMGRGPMGRGPMGRGPMGNSPVPARPMPMPAPAGPSGPPTGGLSGLSPDKLAAIQAASTAARPTVSGGPAPDYGTMNQRATMKKGGSVKSKPKKMANGGSASKRADGCAVKGKTRGKFV